MHALVVDDNPHIISIASRWLTQAGYSVAVSRDFVDAVEHLRSEHPDTLLIDVRLGAFNGLQLALRARENDPDARIVVMSAWDDPVLKKDAEECGARYIVKPFNESQLLEAIQKKPADGESGQGPTVVA